MKIYFAGSILGGRKYEAVYRLIVDYLKDLGHSVLTEHVAYPKRGLKMGGSKDVFKQDMEWLAKCNLFIAEVSNPSLGVGYEVATALHLQKPVLCLHQEGVEVSNLIIGNTSEGITTRSYRNEEDLKKNIEKFLNIYAKREFKESKF